MMVSCQYAATSHCNIRQYFDSNPGHPCVCCGILPVMYLANATNAISVGLLGQSFHLASLKLNMKHYGQLCIRWNID